MTLGTRKDLTGRTPSRLSSVTNILFVSDDGIKIYLIEDCFDYVLSVLLGS